MLKALSKPAQGRLARADLLRLLHVRAAQNEPDLQSLSLACSPNVAHDAGYWRVAATDGPRIVELAGNAQLSFSASAGFSPPVQTILQLEHMWLVTEHTPPQSPTQPEQTFAPLPPLTEEDAQAPSSAPPPPFEDLVPRARLTPLLKRLMQQPRPGALDVPQLVEHISQRRLPHHAFRHWPRKAQAHWPAQLTVVLDFSDHLYPVHQDMHRLCRWLVAVFGRTCLSLRLHQHGPGAAWSDWHAHQSGGAGPVAQQPWHMPPAGSAVLVVTDFGLTLPHSAAALRWQAFGRSLRTAGCQPFALVPLGAQQIPVALASIYTLVRWSPDAPAQPQRPPKPTDAWAAPSDISGLAPLLAMIASTRRVDPPLLRALRQINPLAPRNAGLELAAWNHPDVEAGSACWVVNDTAKNQVHQALFAHNPAWHAPVRALTTTHHGHLRAGLNHEETLRWAALLSPQARQANQKDIDKALAYFQAMLGNLSQHPNTQEADKWLRYADRVVRGIEEAVRQQAPDLFNRFATLLAPHWRAAGLAQVPAWVDPQALSENTQHKPLPYWLVHDFASGAAQLQPQPAQPRQSLLAGPMHTPSVTLQTSPAAQSAYWLELTGQTVHLPVPGQDGSVTVRYANEALTLAQLERPAWASEWGQDRAGPHALRRRLFGPPQRFSPLASEEEVVRNTGAFAYGHDEFGDWASLHIQDHTQTLRYLPPGTFLMGSPPDEPDRYQDEGPQHKVTLTEGLWLADTACTQGLWLAVMGGKNPSHFTGNLDLPVEQISWEDVQEFLAKLQSYLPEGVQAVLPTEAQWEYACRAGTATPFSFGQHISTDQVNYNGNHPYNQGPKGEYRGKTVPVKAMPANGWGLYQMHGNVLEWCADAVRDYTNEAVTDASGASGKGIDYYAVRGGSWVGYAQLARSAQRFYDGPDWRIRRLGFRFALRSTGQPGAGGPASVGRSPSLGRDGPVSGVRSTRRKK